MPRRISRAQIAFAARSDPNYAAAVRLRARIAGLTRTQNAAYGIDAGPVVAETFASGNDIATQVNGVMNMVFAYVRDTPTCSGR